MPTTVSPATPPPDDPQISTETGAQLMVRSLRNNHALATKVVREIEASVEATTPVWDAATKAFADRPDYKTRLAACEIILAYTVGLPVQRNENLNLSVAPQLTAEERQRQDDRSLESPAMRAALRRRLDRAEEKAKFKTTS